MNTKHEIFQKVALFSDLICSASNKEAEVHFVFEKALDIHKQKENTFVAFRGDNNRNSDFQKEEKEKIKKYFYLFDNKDRAPHHLYSKLYTLMVVVAMVLILFIAWINEIYIHASKLTIFTIDIFVVGIVSGMFYRQISRCLDRIFVDTPTNVKYYAYGEEIQEIKKLKPYDDEKDKFFSVFVFVLILFAFQVTSMLGCKG